MDKIVIDNERRINNFCMTAVTITAIVSIAAMATAVLKKEDKKKDKK